MLLYKTYGRNALTIGLFFSLLFIVCYLWYYLRGGSIELKQLHDNLFSLAFFGWSGMNFTSFILGLIQSFIWGYIAVALWYLAKVLTAGSSPNQ